MRAIAVSALRAEPGLMEVPKPDPGPGEVRVKIEYAALNPLDWQTADGTLGGGAEQVFPLVLGVDFAGRVDMIGSGDNRFRVGDPVFGHVPVFGDTTVRPFGQGTYCEYVCVPQDSPIAPVPDGLTLQTAAALPCAGTAAARILAVAEAASARSLLVIGAAGGVGSCLTQLAAARGIQVVAAVRGDEEKRMEALGAALTVDTTTRPDALDSAVRSLCPEGADALADLASAGPATFAAHCASVRVGGVALSTRGAGAQGSADPAGVTCAEFRLDPAPELLGSLATRVTRARLHVPIEIELPLEKAPQSLAQNRAGGARGKTVFTL